MVPYKSAFFLRLSFLPSFPEHILAANSGESCFHNGLADGL
jgi:hypothetical protein